jgi:GPH family glycoside/pentoside/hexuronide:cation symporter
MLGYGLGDLANGITFGMSTAFLLSFYTDVLGITAAAAGTLFLVATVWDAVNDPMMGALADILFRRRLARHPKGKIDKFRPYLLGGSWLVVAAAILMFFAPPSLSGTGRLVWAYATFIGWGMAYTVVNIPYGSLAAVITSDPVERAALSAWRGLGSTVGVALIRVVVPFFLLHYATDQARGYLFSMIVLGGLALAAYMVTYFTTEERVAVKTEAVVKFSFRDTFSVLWRNRPFLAVCLASFAMIAGLTVNGLTNIYYFREILGSLKLMSMVSAAILVPVLAAAASVPALVRRFGTKNVSWASSLLSAFLMGTLLVLPVNPVIFVSLFLLGILALTVPNFVVWGQVSDCIDYNQYLSGARQEGVIYGTYSMIRKIGQTLGGGLAAWGVGWIGYVPGAPLQAPRTLAGIRFLTVGVPALCMAAAFLAYLLIWDLTPRKMEEVAAAISLRPVDGAGGPERTA